MAFFRWLAILTVFVLYYVCAIAQTGGPGFPGLQITRLGPVPGVPPLYGGITFKYDDDNTFLVGGEANASSGAIYATKVIRDANCNITGFTNGNYFANAGDPAGTSIDGGLMYQENSNVLFYVTFVGGYLGQIKPGSNGPDKMINLFTLPGYNSSQGHHDESTGSLAFVPSGFSGAGRLKLASWVTGRLYDVVTTPDGNGTYNISIQSQINIGFDIEGMVYIKGGCSPFFPNDAILIGSYSEGNVYVFDIDPLGNPILSTRRLFVSGISAYEGAAIDPVTGDFLFIDWGGGNNVTRVSGVSCSKKIVPVPDIPTTVSSVCPAQTVDLTKIVAANTPTGFTLTWHTATPVTAANLVSNPTAVGSGTYYASFLPYSGFCTNNAIPVLPVNVLISPKNVPAFAQVNSVCSGDHMDDLPTISTNGITGTWSPALNNTATTVYTFTPDAGQGVCVGNASMTIDVTPLPVFRNLSINCTGEILNAVTVNATVTQGVLEYSVDGGAFQTNSTFNALSPGLHTFDIRVQGTSCQVNSGAQDVSCHCPVVSSNNISASQTICLDTTPAALTGADAAVTPAAAFSYQWQSSTDGIAWTDIASATSKDFSPAANAQTIIYRRLVKMTGCADVASNTVTLTVIQPQQVIVSCGATVFGNVTFSWNTITGNTGYDYTYSINNGAVIAGTTNSNTITVNGLSPSSSVSINVTPAGVCALPGTAACNSAGCPLVNFNTVAADQTICSNSAPATIAGSVADVTPAVAFTYQWQSSTDGIVWNDVPGAAAKDFSPPVLQQTTQYQRLVKIAGCTGVASNKCIVTVNPNLLPSFSIPSAYCEKGSTVLLPKVSDNGIKGSWNLSSISTQVPGSSQYVFTPASGECASGPFQLVITVKSLPPAFSLGNDTGYCTNDKEKYLLLKPAISDQVNYLWQDGSTSNQYQVNVPGNYSLTISNSCGSFSDSIKIFSGEVYCKIFMPNVFTPNGDGQDDVFRVKYPFPVKTFLFVVYNRWGQKVFETDNIYKGWDGLYKGKMQPDGGFAWIMQITDSINQHQFLKGVVLLMH